MSTGSCKFVIYKLEKTPITSDEAVTRVREFIKQKHTKLERISFSRITQEGDFWVLKGEVEYKQAHFFTNMKFFEAKININTGVIMPYKEMYIQLRDDEQKIAVHQSE
ncbi:MAG TPA: hypothetical protein VLH35_04250 [Candidatus Acidoferrales bacterium]|nr:hypothetical protein [Candidatus Acidoferrales bacterium]